MERVSGFGGFFFRSQDPDGLAAWYQEVLGVDPVPQAEGQQPWKAKGGYTVFAPFAADTDYFAPDKSFMLNFRVTDLDAMVAQIEARGIAVKRLPDLDGIGQFAHLTDPEGTPIELWQPAS